MSETKSLNQKFEELEKAKEWFYSDDFNLDEAASKYEAAIALAKDLQKDLQIYKTVQAKKQMPMIHKTPTNRWLPAWYLRLLKSLSYVPKT